MTAPVAPVTEADMALFEDLRGHAFSCESEGDISFDALPVIAAFRTATEAASAAEVAELRAGVEKFLAMLESGYAPFVEDRLSEAMCCSGHMCGCRGASVGEYLAHLLREDTGIARAKPADDRGVG